jgi:DNA helicase HerA-like ATPase
VRDEATLVGYVVAVNGAIVRVRLRSDLTTTLILVDGEAFRVGQIGQFFRLPLGYTQLYGVCTQVGADAAPDVAETRVPAYLDSSDADDLAGYRWLTVALFGESLGGVFDRGVGQYPTVGDELHVVTEADLRTIYGGNDDGGAITVGSIAAASGISGKLEVGPLVTRHACVVGSTGSGKSNLVAILLGELGGPAFPSGRVLVIDPHGEYASALGPKARIYRVRSEPAKGEHELRVPFWALPLDELFEMTMGQMPVAQEATFRDAVLALKREAATHLAFPPDEATLTADSPVPFSIKRLWFELDCFEKQTFSAMNQGPDTALPADEEGDADAVRPSRFPAASPYNTAPYQNKSRRGIQRQLDLLGSRLRDGRYAFLFSPGGGYEPSADGHVEADIDQLLADWLDGDERIAILDVSGLPSDILATVVATMLRVVYDALFWAMDMPVGGRQRPLLVVLDEAHRFLREGSPNAATRAVGTIAREGRKYGVGLLVVSQRPSELDSGVLSQCGTMIALRTTNQRDKAQIQNVFPDDFGGLASLLPVLRTGEGLFLGEALRIPSRVRIRKAGSKPVGDDPLLPDAWQRPRDANASYAGAVANWRAQSTAAAALIEGGGGVGA